MIISRNDGCFSVIIRSKSENILKSILWEKIDEAEQRYYIAEFYKLLLSFISL